MGSSMPVFICFVYWAIWKWTLLVCEEASTIGSKLYRDCALSLWMCTCTLCMCLVCDTDSEATDTQLMHTYVCVHVIKGTAVSFSYTVWKVIICTAIGFKGQPSAGLQHTLIFWCPLCMEWAFLLSLYLVIIFSATLIKNTAVTWPNL